jgi:polyphenol oxidase
MCRCQPICRPCWPNCVVIDCIVPDWPAPARVKALQTTRQGGLSPAPWASLNLGDHVGDLPSRVAGNRQQLRTFLPAEPRWLNQVHGVVAVNADLTPISGPALNTSPGGEVVTADAAYARQPNRVCVVMTADCLPVFFCDRAGSVVAVAHAGWRGLLAGVLEETVHKMGVPAADLLAWLGPAIGPKHFEVGAEVRSAFVARDAGAATAFQAKGDDKWLADIYRLARQRLSQCGVGWTGGGDFCTVSEVDRFFSYRRDGVTGRMASLIWLVDG